MDVSQFDYYLPASSIAQYPAAERSNSRLLVVGQVPGDHREIRFHALHQLLEPGDILVANDTRVVPARLQALKPTGGKVEILLERLTDLDEALVQLRSSKPVRPGQVLLIDDCEIEVTARQGTFYGIKSRSGLRLEQLFFQRGAVPLPPYIDRAPAQEDDLRYQTVYAVSPGAVAAPTAGLHFDENLIDRLVESGIHWETVTLHVGAGTFQPVRGDSVEAHAMHRERIEVKPIACDRINAVRQDGGRVIAVGTTVVRALESAAKEGKLEPLDGDSELFIFPGYNFQVVDALITNFHLPRSTLLMMVCAFGGYERIMGSYQYAIEHDFRFYSYGDAMFIDRGTA